MDASTSRHNLGLTIVGAKNRGSTRLNGRTNSLKRVKACYILRTLLYVGVCMTTGEEKKKEEYYKGKEVKGTLEKKKEYYKGKEVKGEK